MTVNSEILSASIRHSIWLERYRAQVAKKALAELNKANRKLVERIAGELTRIEERGYSLSAATQARLTQLLRLIADDRAEVFSAANDYTADELKDFAVYEAEFQAKMIKQAAMPVAALDMAMPTKSQLYAAVTKQPFRGRLLKNWYAGLAANDAQRVTDALRIGIADGQTTDQIVRQIRGTRALGYSDGVLDITRREAYSMVRTATAHVAARAKEDLIAANDDIVLGEQWIATLDSRTTATCASLDGKIFDIGKGPQVPRHFNCRSQRIPYLGETDIEGTRASKFGPVPESTTYEQWLRGQSASVQDDILGEAKGKLFREGGLKLDRFVDGSGREYTLKQLRKRDSDIFEAIFGDDARNI
ncbi:MAG: hypothetical protein CMM93_02305 [Rickettsiales bacterium]|nr:hypothetical protein [Rickettsiales bacterium]|tara:strand:+ start:1736 stop:2815 length:1080 start_codon:yes stop_codon:yes gene_type:complete